MSRQRPRLAAASSRESWTHPKSAAFGESGLGPFHGAHRRPQVLEELSIIGLQAPHLRVLRPRQCRCAGVPVPGRTEHLLEAPSEVLLHCRKRFVQPAGSFEAGRIEAVKVGIRSVREHPGTAIELQQADVVDVVAGRNASRE